jgi:cytochrome c-type biogenesis protein CcmH/NrfG
MARQARMRGDTTEALGRYELAISLWPWRQRLVSEALRFAAQTAAPQQTNQLARLAVSLEPDDVDAIRILAGTALDMGDTATAKAAIKDGLKLKPDDDVFLRMRAALDTNW